MPVTRTLSTAANDDNQTEQDLPNIITGMIAVGVQATVAMQRVWHHWQQYANDFGNIEVLHTMQYTASITPFPSLLGADTFNINRGADFLFIFLDDDTNTTADIISTLDRAIQCSTLTFLISFGTSVQATHTEITHWVALGATHCHINTHDYFHNKSSSHDPWKTANQLVTGLLLTANDSGLICVDFVDLHTVLQGPGLLTFQRWALPANEPVEGFVQELSRSALPATLYDNLFVMIEARYTDGMATISHTQDCFAPWGTDQAWMLTGVPTTLFREDGTFAVSVYGVRRAAELPINVQ